MTEKQEIIDVYECFFYRQGNIRQCKYYPEMCNKCGELIKVDEEIINDR